MSKNASFVCCFKGLVRNRKLYFLTFRTLHWQIQAVAALIGPFPNRLLLGSPKGVVPFYHCCSMGGIEGQDLFFDMDHSIRSYEGISNWIHLNHLWQTLVLSGPTITLLQKTIAVEPFCTLAHFGLPSRWIWAKFLGKVTQTYFEKDRLGQKPAELMWVPPYPSIQVQFFSCSCRSLAKLAIEIPAYCFEQLENPRFLSLPVKKGSCVIWKF